MAESTHVEPDPQEDLKAATQGRLDIEQDETPRVYFPDLNCIDTDPGLYIEYITTVERSFLHGNKERKLSAQKKTLQSLKVAKGEDRLALLAAYILWTLAVEGVNLETFDFKIVSELAIISVEEIEAKSQQKRERRNRILKQVTVAFLIVLIGWFYDIVPFVWSFI